jgi:hypothetical protein
VKRERQRERVRMEEERSERVINTSLELVKDLKPFRNVLAFFLKGRTSQNNRRDDDPEKVI